VLTEAIIRRGAGANPNSRSLYICGNLGGAAPSPPLPLVRNVGHLVSLWSGPPVPYDQGVALQERLWAERVAGVRPDTLVLLQHPPTYTFGRGARPEHLLLDTATRQRLGIALFESSRGGDITYHGPGQLVGYPILDLSERGRDVHRYLRDLEQTLIRALADFGLAAARMADRTGVWVGEEKVAAIGVRVSRWVTTHGFALNVDPDLGHFAGIVPCGIRDRGVTALARLLGTAPPMPEVASAVGTAFADVFGVEFESEYQ
jgi:lipoate-protein ligase B